ncbi:unnamed protein product [Durusdinium trenchii]|uniref:Uncharacterized protein n=1 Tax=Durusdinium trenchii TaxID=1381693 RepID=A0ABP0QS60_9DINO
MFHAKCYGKNCCSSVVLLEYVACYDLTLDFGSGDFLSPVLRCCVFFAWLGIRGTLKLPFGPWLAEIVLSRVITCHVDSYQYSKMDSSSSDLRVMEQLSPDPFEQEEFRSDGSE